MYKCPGQALGGGALHDGPTAAACAPLLPREISALAAERRRRMVSSETREGDSSCGDGSCSTQLGVGLRSGNTSVSVSANSRSSSSSSGRTSVHLAWQHCRLCTSTQPDPTLLFCVTCGSDDLSASAQPSPITSSVGRIEAIEACQWSCVYCTAFNDEVVLVCVVCDHEKIVQEVSSTGVVITDHFAPSAPLLRHRAGDVLIESAWTCLCCTLINKSDALKCEVCDSKKIV